MTALEQDKAYRMKEKHEREDAINTKSFIVSLFTLQ